MSGVDMTPSIPGWLRTRRIRARSSWRSAMATGSSWILRLARPGMVRGQDDQLAVGRRDAPPRAPVRLAVRESGLSDPEVGDRVVDLARQVGARIESRGHRRLLRGWRPGSGAAASASLRIAEIGHTTRDRPDRRRYFDFGRAPRLPRCRKSAALQEHAALKPDRVGEGAVATSRELGQEPEHQGAGNQGVAPGRVATHHRHAEPRRERLEGHVRPAGVEGGGEPHRAEGGVRKRRPVMDPAGPLEDGQVEGHTVADDDVILRTGPRSRPAPHPGGAPPSPSRP